MTTHEYQCDCPNSLYKFSEPLQHEHNTTCKDCGTRLKWLRNVSAERYVVDPGADDIQFLEPVEGSTECNEQLDIIHEAVRNGFGIQPDLFDMHTPDTGYDKLPM